MTVRELTDLYSKFGHQDRITMREGYHDHQYSPENQEAAFEFLDHFNGMPIRRDLPPTKELDGKALRVTRTGQVMLDYANARSLMDEIRDYYEEHKDGSATDLKHLYYSELYPGISSWTVREYEGAIPGSGEIRWENIGSTQWGSVSIDRYLLRHSRYLEMPLLWIHRNGQHGGPVLLWLADHGKATAQDWRDVRKYLDAGYDVISIDPRGQGETRMPYKAASPDDPELAQMDFEQAYVSPLSGVLADYVYNSILTGRPYFLEMIEDVEIAMRFSAAKLASRPGFLVTGSGRGYTLASAISETLPNVGLLAQPEAHITKWSEIVEQKRELWPIEFLLPGGAYIH